MRKLLLAALSLLSFAFSYTQVNEADNAIAKQLVGKNSAALGLTANDINNSIVANTYKVTGSADLRMVYLQQSYLGVPVFNELQVLAFDRERLVSNAGSRIASLESKVNSQDGIPALTVLDAVRNSLLDAKLISSEQIVPINITSDGRKYEFGKLGVAVENITAELMWYPVADDKKVLRLAWQVFLAPANSSDYWLVRIDAMTGNVLAKQNLTITCHWDDRRHSVKEHVEKNHVATASIAGPQQPVFFKKREKEVNWKYRPLLINSANYRVVPYPYESPTHMGGGGSGLVNNPWTMAPGNATSLGWHNDGLLDHDSTRGNNVWAAEDRNATNATIDKAAVSTTPGPNLNFDYAPDYTVSPILSNPPNQQFNITNLFYWNNIVHDISYLYGFDEVGGNFQNNNQGRGGLGNDYVIADAQDGGGTSNANFATPVDGTRPRMQMYIWTAPNPDRDGDVDNGIVAHEFTHGISNRLTGGPGNSSCLGNAEHGGEGWSDYFALMVTTNWATASITDGFNIPRGIGTYAMGQPITGLGIRNFRYCTNTSVNPLMYGATIPAQAHDRGEYWCMALWEMTWEIIQQAGINPNLYNPGGGGGNAVALKLVIEGMRLQPCNPGFIDARNAILRADTIFYNGLYSCSIWRAFAKRGMGRNASQGSSASVTDQVPSFLVDNGVFSITQSTPQVQEGNNVTYTNTVLAGTCSPMNNYYITDTLPTHVTYVSGGTYNGANRTVTFGPVNLLSNQSQAYSFTVSVNNGSYFIPVTHFNETVPTTSIPATWTPTSISSTVWATSGVQSNSSPNSFFAPDPVTLSDHQLATTSTYTLSAAPSAYTTFSFWHRFNTEDGWDGGVVEISTNGGASWSDLGSKMIMNGYNGALGVGSNLAGRQAFTGLGNSFRKTVVNLSSYAGQTIKIRFRFASDDNTAPTGGGWFVDDIVLYTEPAVYIKSNLYNSLNEFISRTDTITKILPNANCTPVSLTGQPTNVTECAGNNAVFTAAATGTGPFTYQWQLDSGSGFADISNIAPYAGTNTATLTVSNITTAMNGHSYRVVISNSCSNQITTSATLTVTAAATVNTQPLASTVCEGTNTSFTVNATGATGYQWQVNTGSGFTNITNGSLYSGATTATLNITGVLPSMHGYQYQVVMSSCGPNVNSNSATLSVSAPVSVVAPGPADVVICDGGNALFTVVGNGAVTGYQWQVSTDGGATYNDITGQTGATLTLNSVLVSQSGNRYRATVIGSCNAVNSNGAVLTVNPTPVFTFGNIPAAICISDTAINLTATGAGGTWSGNGVSGSQLQPSGLNVGATTVTYTASNSFGCSAAQSRTIQVNECPERHLTLGNPNSLIVFPNPNGGVFNIRVRSDLYTKLEMRVYASDGKLVATRIFTGLYYNRVVPVNLAKLSSGVYHLFIYNNENGLVKKTFSVVINR